jgi:hypothetical protein
MAAAPDLRMTFALDNPTDVAAAIRVLAHLGETHDADFPTAAVLDAMAAIPSSPPPAKAHVGMVYGWGLVSDQG